MLIDTNDIINSESIYLKICFKDGKEFETEIKSSDIKSIDVKIKESPYRKSLWENEKIENEEK